ncbi:Alpha-farnesene synthase [Sesamum alatum]|uniref:Alpha-farnesene synthase n=1 Tax=Sesamum alatum TaxID=300844 RepID=A0AAE1YYX8_9LAMI|nr:Alpha-farnesene synthase [Sesamum alatum]
MEMRATHNDGVDGDARRTANYKPNIWNYDHLQSLTSVYNDEKYKREAETLKEEVCVILAAFDHEDPLYKLELIDEMEKLALSSYFEEEIRESLDKIASMKSSGNADLYSTALYLRILRQHGHHVSPDAILRTMEEEEEKLVTSACSDGKAMLEVFEASHLGLEDECLMDRAKAFATKNIRVFNLDYDNDVEKIGKFPLHWSVSWFNAKKHIQMIQAKTNKSTLQRLAGLSFNILQLQHQNELKQILRWWRNLGVSEVLTFTRDRVVESFLWAVGVAYEPQYESLRKWLTKAILLVLIIDDVYDMYGSNHELQQFTTAVERWDSMEIQHLPESIKRCFWLLYDTINNMDHEIQKEKGWNSVLPHLKKVWTGFCKALFVEAKWYHSSHSPSLSEYLDNGWTSSSGPLLSLHILIGIGHDITQTIHVFNNCQEIIRLSSLIIRLCNDQGTSKAELERGDAHSSILCHRGEANVTEAAARGHIKNLVTDSWKKINGLFISAPRWQQPMIRYVVNTARVATFIYQNGDGFGVQDRETRDQVLSCLIQPLPLN